jgi:hypothetical protein
MGMFLSLDGERKLREHENSGHDQQEGKGTQSMRFKAPSRFPMKKERNRLPETTPGTPVKADKPVDTKIRKR